MISIIVIAVLPAVLGQQVLLQNCDKFVQQTKQNFSAEAYLGKWYEIARYETFFQGGGDCVTAKYSTLPDGKIGVLNEQKNLATQKPGSIEGYAVEKNPGANDGKLLVKFPISPLAPYWVVDTDYKNFSVVWSCVDILPISIQFLWILARENTLTPNIQATVDDILKKNNLSKDKLRITTTSPKKCGTY